MCVVMLRQQSGIVLYGNFCLSKYICFIFLCILNQQKNRICIYIFFAAYDEREIKNIKNEENKKTEWK